MTRIRTFASLALVSLVSLAHAEADYSTPKSAFRTDTQALADGNIEVLRSAAITTAKHEKLLETQVKYSAIDRKFREACVKAFPAAAKQLPDPTKQTLESIETADVKIDGDTALIQTRDSVEPLKMKRVDNRWKVDLASIYDEDEAIAELVSYWSATAYVMNDMVVDVGAGKYKTFDEVRNMLEMRVKMRMALPQSDEATTQPTN